MWRTDHRFWKLPRWSWKRRTWNRTLSFITTSCMMRRLRCWKRWLSRGYVADDSLNKTKSHKNDCLLLEQFKRATVGNSNLGEARTVSYRISKSAFLEDGEHKFIQDITRRVEDMTGLTVATYEKLQVANYGIGGHYLPHLDFKRGAQLFTHEKWMRPMVTVLFYVTSINASPRHCTNN